MAQGKSKAKAQLPKNVKAKKKFTTKNRVISRSRPNAPAAPKLSSKAVEAAKLKKKISKGVSEAMENELRAKAFDGKKSLLSKKELAEKEAARK